MEQQRVGEVAARAFTPVLSFRVQHPTHLIPPPQTPANTNNYLPTPAQSRALILNAALHFSMISCVG